MDEVKGKLGSFITGEVLRVCKVNIKSFYEAMCDIVPFFEKLDQKEKGTTMSDKAFEKHCNQAIEYYYELACSHIASKKKDGYFYICIHGSQTNLSITYTTTLLSEDRLHAAFDTIEKYGFDAFPKEVNYEEIHAQADIQVIHSVEDLLANKEEINKRLVEGNGVLCFKNTTKASRTLLCDTLNKEILQNQAIISKTELRKMSISSYTAIHFSKNDVAYAGLKNEKDIDTLACLFDKAFLVQL